MNMTMTMAQGDHQHDDDDDDDDDRHDRDADCVLVFFSEIKNKRNSRGNEIADMMCAPCWGNSLRLQIS